MPTVTEKEIEAYASCRDGRCAGYKQQPVKAYETETQFSYVDLGGDIPGIERSTTLIRFADEADATCEICDGPRLVSDQVRPIYPNISGVPQDRLLYVNDDSEKLRDVMLADAKRDAAMAQMQANMERQLAASERQQAEIERLNSELASRPRGPGRPRKTENTEE